MRGKVMSIEWTERNLERTRMMVSLYPGILKKSLTDVFKNLGAA